MVTVGALVAALMIQLTILNGLPLPGGGTPDLVLLGVICVGLIAGPRPGIAAGFWFGLALDLAPPAVTVPGQYALVLCLAGYAAGRLRRRGDVSARRAFAALTVVTAVAIGAELAVAGLALVLGHLRVAPGLLVPVLVSSALYDIACIPLLVTIAVRVAAAGKCEPATRSQVPTPATWTAPTTATATPDRARPGTRAQVPRIAFSSGHGLTSAGSRQATAPSRNQRRRQPMFGGSSTVVTAVSAVTGPRVVGVRAARSASARRPARMRAGRGPSRLLPWTRRPGGRSAVWRIGSRRAGVLR
jgi:rod shape-determining protein MreD